jgi:TonB family protein
MVMLDVHIALDGSVTRLWVLKSIPLLDDAAASALRQWRFESLDPANERRTISVIVDFTLPRGSRQRPNPTNPINPTNRINLTNPVNRHQPVQPVQPG